MTNELVTAYWDYVKQSWHQDQSALSYQEWLESRVSDLTAALTPFARFGLLKHPYAPEAVFTLVHDRDGHRVVIQFSDFIEAAKQIPGLALTSTDSEPVGAAGGIAEIMVGDPLVNLSRVEIRVDFGLDETRAIEWLAFTQHICCRLQRSLNRRPDFKAVFYAEDLDLVTNEAKSLGGEVVVLRDVPPDEELFPPDNREIWHVWIEEESE